MPTKPRNANDPTAQRRRFAALYANGPAALKGNFDAVNTALGTAFTVDDIELRKAVAAEGSTLPYASKKQAMAVSESDGAVEDPIDPASPLTGTDWKAKLPELLKTMDDIMAGNKKASAGQVSLIKEVLSRALDSDKGQQLLGVAIVPTIGCNENQQVCPRCGQELVQDLNGSGETAED